MRHRGLREAAAVLAGAFVLTAALTWPLVPQLDRVGRVNTDDGRWSLWVVSWVADALIVNPRGLYDANIFYPARNTLAYSEANLGAGLLALPAWSLTGNPYLAHNSVVVVGFLLAVSGAYYLVRYLSGSREAAAIAGVLFGFCPFVFARTAHIQLLLTAGLPWSMLAFHRLVDRQTPGRAVALGLVLWAQALSCAYYGIFAGLMVGLGTLVFAITRGLWRSTRYWGLVALAAAVALALTMPFFLPYLRVQDQGFSRTLDDARTYSANGGAWLASSAWAHRWWLRRHRGLQRGAVPGRHRRRRRRRRRLAGAARPRWPAASARPRRHRLLRRAGPASPSGRRSAPTPGSTACSSRPCRSSRSCARRPGWGSSSRSRWSCCRQRCWPHG